MLVSESEMIKDLQNERDRFRQVEEENLKLMIEKKDTEEVNDDLNS